MLDVYGGVVSPGGGGVEKITSECTSTCFTFVFISFIICLHQLLIIYVCLGELGGLLPTHGYWLFWLLVLCHAVHFSLMCKGGNHWQTVLNSTLFLFWCLHGHLLQWDSCWESAWKLFILSFMVSAKAWAPVSDCFPINSFWVRAEDGCFPSSTASYLVW